MAFAQGYALLIGVGTYEHEPRMNAADGDRNAWASSVAKSAGRIAAAAPKR
jgi:hypothetical protein